MKLPEFGVKRPVTITMIALGLLLFGFISLTKIGLDFLPEIDIPVTAVVIPYPGADPETVEEQITKVVEPSLRTVSGVNTIMANSLENMAVIVMEFEWGTDLKDASEEIRSLFDMLSYSLPTGASTPMIYKVDMNQIPLMALTVAGGEAIDTSQWVDEVLRPALESVSEVGRIDVNGQPVHQIEVAYYPEKLAEYNISPSVIGQMLAYQNLMIPAGTIEDGGLNYNLRAGYAFTSIEDIESLVVGQAKGEVNPFLGIAIPRMVRLGDVAEVREVFSREGQISTVNGKPAIVVMVYQASDANAVNASRAILNKLSTLNQDGYEVEVLFNQSDFIEMSLESLVDNMLVGGVLAIIVLLVFLRNWRTTLINAISIPFSVIVSFALMYAFGIDFNLISLGGLALGVGMLVDNSIVVLENIFRKQQEGMEPDEAAITGTKEVGMAIFASTLTTLVVFLPVVFLSSLAGTIFKELALTVTFSLTSSLLVALTLVPLLASKFLRVDEKEREKYAKSAVSKIENGYRGMLAKIISGRGKYAWLLGTGVFVIIAVVLLQFMDFELFSQEYSNEISVTLSLPAGTPLWKTAEVVEYVEPKIVELPEVENIYTLAGTSSGMNLMSLGSSNNTANLTVMLETKEGSFISKSDPVAVAGEILKILEDAKKVYPDLEVDVTVSDLMAQTGLSEGNVVRVMGKDAGQVEEVALKITEELKSWPEVISAGWSYAEDQPLMELAIDPAKVLLAGQVSAQVAQSVRQAIVGETVGYAEISGSKLPVVFKAHSDSVGTLEDLENLYLPAASTGQTATPMGLRLGNVVEVNRTRSPFVLQRTNGQRVVEIALEVAPDAISEVDKRIADYLSTLEMPAGVSVDRGMMEKFKLEVYDDLILTAALAIILIYMVMASQFEGFLSPLIIMVTLPLALIGSAIFLFVYDRTLNISGIIGMIILSGIVVNNGIVLVDYINQLRRRGMGLEEATVKGAGDRLRAILMTALTTILGLLPQALSLNSYTNIQIPMALAVMGGLLTSTLLTLTVVPCIYYLLEKARKKVRERG